MRKGNIHFFALFGFYTCIILFVSTAFSSEKSYRIKYQNFDGEIVEAHHSYTPECAVNTSAVIARDLQGYISRSTIDIQPTEIDATKMVFDVNEGEVKLRFFPNVLYVAQQPTLIKSMELANFCNQTATELRLVAFHLMGYIVDHIQLNRQKGRCNPHFQGCFDEQMQGALEEIKPMTDVDWETQYKMAY